MDTLITGVKAFMKDVDNHLKAAQYQKPKATTLDYLITAMYWFYKVVAEIEELNAILKRETDTSFDGTDFASPAWWRGDDHGVMSMVHVVNEWLDLPIDYVMAGMSHTEIQALKERIVALRRKAGDE